MLEVLLNNIFVMIVLIGIVSTVIKRLKNEKQKKKKNGKRKSKSTKNAKKSQAKSVKEKKYKPLSNQHIISKKVNQIPVESEMETGNWSISSEAESLSSNKRKLELEKTKMVDAIIWSEILGPPKGRKMQSNKRNNNFR